MMVRRIAVALALTATSAAAQSHVFSFVGGAGQARIRGTASGMRAVGDVGVASTIETSRLFAWSAELRYAERGRDGLRLSYVETPLLVRVSGPKGLLAPFVRAGLAPAFELRCSALDRSNNPETRRSGNQPDTRRVIADPVGYKYHPLAKQPNLDDHIACMNQRQRKLDVGTVAAVGVLFREGRERVSLELRWTEGLRNLSDIQGQVVRNRAIALLLSFGSREF